MTTTAASTSSTSVDPRATKLRERHARLATERSNFDSVYQELRELVRPDTSDFTSSQNRPGEERRKVYDGTATWAADMLASGLHSYLSNPVDQWFGIGVAGVPLAQLSFSSKAWLEQVSDLIYNHYSQPATALNPTLHEAYLDLSSFGMTGIYHWFDRETNLLKFRSYPLASIWVDENAHGDVNLVQRKIRWTVAQIEDEFGELPTRLARLKREDKVDVIHEVSQNSFYEPSSRVPTRKKWTSLYVCLDTNEVLEQTGLDKMPYLTPRWSKMCGDKYARGPGVSILPEIRMVNAMSKSIIMAAQKMVDPPLMVEDDGYMLPIRTHPGGLNMRRPGSEPIMPLPTAQRIDIGVEMIEQRREMIRRGFYIDWIVRGQKKERQTAHEIMDERNQMLGLMAPIVGRIQSELLGPMLRLSFFYLARAGLIPPAPDELDGAELDVTYVSPAARAQSTARGQGMIAYVQQISQLLPILPGIVDSLDEDALNSELQDQLDVPRRVLLSPEKVTEKRKAREEQTKMSQMAQVGPAMAKSAKDLATAKAEGFTVDV